MKSNEQNRSLVLRLTESALMIAFATLLSMMKFFEMPQGGTVTPFSMLPLCIIAYRYRTRWGLVAGSAFGLLQMILGMKNLSYASSILALVCIILFDYLIAFGVLGLGGLFRGKLGNNQAIELSLGVLLVCILRFACHFISGWAVWGVWAPEGTPAWLYSLGYNASYMIPETVITMIMAVLLSAFLNFQNDNIGIRRHKEEEEFSVGGFLLKMLGVLTALTGILYLVTSFVYKISNAEYELPPQVLLILIPVCCLAAGVVLYILGIKVSRKKKASKEEEITE
ncbi:MAG: energy-coupled thiamine transporter ThiT [Clostridia bacterium]|nr:energy-coupled thiamine transporter ThiT [Clostridia bacterium]